MGAALAFVLPVRHCLVCGEEIPPRAYQNQHTVRACGPGCAHSLFRRENPGWNSYGQRPSKETLQ